MRASGRSGISIPLKMADRLANSLSRARVIVPSTGRIGQYLKPLRLPLSALGVVFLLAMTQVPHGYDLTSYWHIPDNPYPAIDSLTGQAVFRYAPPVMLLFRPLDLLPWEGVEVVWLALQLVALRYVAGRWFLVAILFPPVWLDLAFGNVYLFLTAVIVAGFRHPGVWAFVVLTKVTPGVGLVWFAVRREWRSLAVAFTVTLAVVVVSLVVQGTSVWGSWFDSLIRQSRLPLTINALPFPLLPRLVLFVGLIGYGALTDRRWLVPVAFVLAMPTLWVIAFAPLVALPSSIRPSRRNTSSPR